MKLRRKQICLGLRLVAFVPEYNAKKKTNDYSHEETDGVILWVPPVRPMLFPEASLTLGDKGLGVFVREI